MVESEGLEFDFCGYKEMYNGGLRELCHVRIEGQDEPGDANYRPSNIDRCKNKV